MNRRPAPKVAQLKIPREFVKHPCLQCGTMISDAQLPKHKGTRSCSDMAKANKKANAS